MKNNRILIIDAIRGLALLLITLIHYIEHFELFAQPGFRILVPKLIDDSIFHGIMYMVGGKAYSIFAIMFGFSFFLQLNRMEQKGINYKRQFAWRLVILLFLGFFHSLIYKGDILHIYALLGLLLIPLYRLRIRYLLPLCAFFLIQVPTIIQIFQSFLVPGYTFTPTFGWGFWNEIDHTYMHGNFWEVLQFNFWRGRTSVWGWTFYTGRYLQLFGLFIAGLIIGKLQFFENMEQHKKLIKQVMTVSFIMILVLLAGRDYLQVSQASDLQKQLLDGLLNMYANIAFTLVYVSAFILIYLQFKMAKFIHSFAVFGRMSLTNYIVQAVFGVVFFYGFGFGMYNYIGAGLSLLMGILFFWCQVQFSKYWLKHYYYGPIEWFWRSATKLDFSIKLRRAPSIGEAGIITSKRAV